MDRTTQIETSLNILVPQAWTNDQKGAFLESIAATVLRRQSYEVTSRVRFTGMEIDLLARHKPSNNTVYVECKFQNSSVSANVIDLILGQSFRRKLNQVALFSAGPLSKEAKGVIEDLRSDNRVNFSFYGPDSLLEALLDSGTVPQIPEQLVPPSVSHAALLIHPEHPSVWLLQDQRDGCPYRLLAYSGATKRPDLPDLRALLDKHEVLEGLPLDEYLGASEEVATPVPTAAAVQPVEVVGRVATADTILDYRPCRPEDFVGRLGVQQELWNFLDEVRAGQTQTRLVAVVGASGYGKSSLVAKLAERFRNKKWKNKYFLFPVDVRSARGPLFVAEALLQTLRSAAEVDFIKSTADLSIADADSVLEGESIRRVLSELAQRRRVLVVFFDQFEEVFTKDELLPIFRVFRRFALDAHAKGANLVVGFSWRTGISLPNDNPAYQLWNELRDYRLTKQLGHFDAAESSGLIGQYETELETKLLPPLRRRLQEQGQGVPWFLKKLCIHVHGQISKGVSQPDLLGSRLNVQALFDEDLDPLTEAQLHCLRFIAKNSPVDSLEAYERYGSDVVSDLINKRLVVRAGQRFAVYWDIFRDYLTEDKVPSIPWTYIPTCTLRMALVALKSLTQQGPMSTAELGPALAYSESTVVNIVTDLQNLALLGKDSSGKHCLLYEPFADSVPERIRESFAEHIVYVRLLEAAAESGTLSRAAALEIVRALYSGADVKPATRDHYLGRLQAWFEYSGLIESDGSLIRVRSPQERGRKFGHAALGVRASRNATFLGSATPEVTEELLTHLLSTRLVPRSYVESKKLRNSVVDLSALGLARWSDKGLVATKPSEAALDAATGMRLAVCDAPAFVLFEKLVHDNKGVSRADVGTLLARELNKDWKPSSALRYANGLYRYRDYVRGPVVDGLSAGR